MFDVASESAWIALLEEADHIIHSDPAAGETTGIALVVTNDAGSSARAREAPARGS